MKQGKNERRKPGKRPQRFTQRELEGARRAAPDATIRVCLPDGAVGAARR